MPANRINDYSLGVAGFIKFWLPVLLCMGLIFYISSIPAGNIPPLFSFQDILYHFFIYLVLALFFIRALKKTYLNLTTTRIILFTLIFGILYGITDELHQGFVPYRDASIFDVFIDATGTFAGNLLYIGLCR